MPTYASRTTVSPERSRIEIEQVLQKYGATAFMYGATAARAVLQFELRDRRYRLSLILPTIGQSKAELKQEIWSLWRSLLLVIKAKLVAVDAGISTIEEEFLAYLVLHGGETAGDWLIPQITSAYAEQRLPPLLPAPRKPYE